MKSRITLCFIVSVLALLALSSSVVQAKSARPAQQVVPPFNWANAGYDPTNGGYCDPGGLCAAPHDQMPSGYGQYCNTAWCSYPTNDLCLQLGLCGGLGGGGGACDYSTDCFVNMVGAIQPPAATDCPSDWPICAALYGTPTPPPPTPGNPPPTPVSSECPLNLRISQPAPTFNLGPFAPAHPIVVGRDPQRRGVDVPAGVQIPPVIVKYDVAKYTHTCEYVGGDITDSACQNQPGWKNTKVFAGCETKTEVYPDRINSVQVTADLSAASIDWITTELAAKYPGAHVYQAHWSLWPGSLSQGGLSADGTALSLTAAHLPLADPGRYTVAINGTTTGTPYTAPRTFAYSNPDLLVYLLESTIIK